MQLVADLAGTMAVALLALSASDRVKLELSCHQFPG
jgi:hypothetical protein